MNDNKPSAAYDLDTHHLLQLKIVPDSLIALRTELAYHKDILEACLPLTTFEECLGMIAAKLDIALDGDYDVQSLCSLLVTALKGRGGFLCNLKAYNINQLSLPGLIPAEIEEREDKLTLVRRED